MKKRKGFKLIKEVKSGELPTLKNFEKGVFIIGDTYVKFISVDDLNDKRPSLPK